MIQKKGKNISKKKGSRLVAVALFIFSAILLIAGFPLTATAHSPKNVVLTYDQAKKMLEVRITHGVSDPAKHYIDKVEIRKAGKTVSTTEYQSQPGPETFSYTYPLDAAPGDVIEVKATCSVFGSKTEKLTVGK